MERIFLKIALAVFGLILVSVLVFASTATYLNKRNTSINQTNLFIFRGPELAFRIAGSIFILGLGYISSIAFPPTDNFILFWMFLILVTIGYLLYYEPYYVCIKDNNRLEIRTIIRTMDISISNIQTVRRTGFKKRAYITLQGSPNPFGITLFYDYFEGHENDGFITKLRELIKENSGSTTDIA